VLRVLRILAGVLLLVSGVATLLYGRLLDSDFRAELRESRRNR
jgi:hypothetical protein